MQELTNKKLELIGQAVISLGQFLCVYLKLSSQEKVASYNKQALSGTSLGYPIVLCHIHPAVLNLQV